MSLNSFKSVDFDPFALGELVYTAPITEPQREIWLASLMGDEANCAFNESINLHLQGEFDRATLETAVFGLIKRHDALRTTISADGESLCINNELAAPIIYTDVSALTQEEQTAHIAQHEKDAVTTAFDLIQGPLFQLHVLKLSITQHQIIVTLHHIIADGWSQAVLLHDLGQFYKAAATDTLAQLSPALQYSDYAYMMQERQQKQELQVQEEYWIKQYAADIPHMDIPTDHPYPKMRTFQSGFISHKLDAELISALRKLGAQSGCTFFTTLLSAYALFLNRLQNQSDLVIGIPAAGQSVIGEDHLVGHCVNMLPLRCFVDNTLPFKDLLTEMRPRVLDAYEHQEFTFGSLIDKLPIERDLSRVPLVPITFNIDQEQRILDFGLIQGFYTTNPRFNETFELTINCADSKNEFVVECDYNQALFDKETIQRRLAEFEVLIRNIISNPTDKMATLSLLPSNEQDLILHRWNQTKTEYDTQPTPTLIHQQAKLTPDAVALRFGENILSYQQLDEQSNQVAHYLKAQGVVLNTLVGLSMGRSLNTVVALLGIWKAGGAYVPLDPAYPKARLLHMVDDSDLSLLITETDYKDLFDDFAINTVVWEDIVPKIETHPTTPLTISLKNTHRAYVIYTSGSTGLPKGVQVQHQALTNFLWSMQREPGLCADDVLASVTTLSFDIHGLEIWLPLITGAEIVIVPTEVSTDGLLLANLLDETNSTVLQATPATWKLLLDSEWNGRSQLKMLCGGEPLPKALAEKLLKRGGELWNMYGPTETTIWSSIAKIEPDTDLITIGRPIANTQMYILNNQLQPVPIGVTGELYIGGDGVTLGYLNRDELTQERFIVNPFGAGKIYNTGDLARFTASGEIVCLGRSDVQVKVRGYRIELGEIETVLSRYEAIEDIVVTVQENSEDDKRIVAYYKSVTEQDSQRLRKYANQSLPYYMVPSIFEPLAEFPLTPNGKIDRKALPAPQYEIQLDRKQIVAPESETEKAVANIWQSLLGINQISIFDDFFDLGGHSLMAAKIINRITNQFGKRMSLQMFFNTSTIAVQAQYIDIHLIQREPEAVIPTDDLETIEL